MRRCNNLLAYAVILVLSLTICGCVAMAPGETSVDDKEVLLISSDVGGFEEVASFYDADTAGNCTYYRERITNVMYVMKSGSRFANGFTVMLDPETGGPLTYDKWLTYLDERTEKTGGGR